MSVAGLVIRYVAVLCHLIPELLGNAALKDNGDGIVSAFRTQRYGVYRLVAEIHDLTGYRTDHGSRRNGNDRRDRRDIRSHRQLDRDGSGTLVDLRTEKPVIFAVLVMGVSSSPPLLLAEIC